MKDETYYGAEIMFEEINNILERQDQRLNALATAMFAGERALAERINTLEFNQKLIESAQTVNSRATKDLRASVDQIFDDVNTIENDVEDLQKRQELVEKPAVEETLQTRWGPVTAEEIATWKMVYQPNRGYRQTPLTLEKLNLSLNVVGILKHYDINTLERLLQCSAALLHGLPYLVPIHMCNSKLDSGDIAHIVEALEKHGLRLKPHYMPWDKHAGNV